MKPIITASSIIQKGEVGYRIKASNGFKNTTFSWSFIAFLELQGSFNHMVRKLLSQMLGLYSRIQHCTILINPGFYCSGSHNLSYSFVQNSITIIFQTFKIVLDQYIIYFKCYLFIFVLNINLNWRQISVQTISKIQFLLYINIACLNYLELQYLQTTQLGSLCMLAYLQICVYTYICENRDYITNQHIVGSVIENSSFFTGFMNVLNRGSSEKRINNRSRSENPSLVMSWGNGWNLDGVLT